MDRVRWMFLVLVVGCTFRPVATGAGDAHSTDTSTADAHPTDTMPLVAPKCATEAGSDEVGVMQTSNAVTLPQGVAAGDIVVVGVSVGGSTSITVEDTGSNAFAPVASVEVASSQSVYTFWARVATSLASETVTVVYADAVYNQLMVGDYTSVNASADPFDRTAVTGSGTGSQGSVLLTTTRADDALVVMLGDTSGTPPTAGSGYTVETVSDYSLFEDATAATPGSYTATAGLPDGTSWSVVLLAIEGPD
jgi:hypothetical protein